MSHRTARVSSLMREVLASLLSFEVKDPRVAGVTLTEVEVAGDLSLARVYIQMPGDAKAREQALAGLRSAAGFLRREVGRRIQMRTTPELDFRYDSSTDYGQRIDQKLAELGLGGPEPSTETDADPDPDEST